MEEIKINRNRLIEQSINNKRILKGTIIKISNLNIVVSLNTNSDDENNLIYIPKEESNLYTPKTAKTEVEKMLFLQRTVGRSISFVVIGYEMIDKKKMAIGSMKVAAHEYFESVKRQGVDNIDKIAIVNVISSGNRFAAIEYNGFVTTVSDRELSYSEVNSVSAYIRKNKCRDFEIVRIDPYQEYIEFTRKDVIGDVFMKRVFKEAAYKVGDMVMGKIIGSTTDDRMIIEIENEILAIGGYPRDRVAIGDKISGIISGINKGKRKIYLSNIAVL